ncbi:MAG: glycosyltransferase [Atopobiaceae bacterium]|nr:glycosyltransferase [Atopobiaceae bacterium]
MPCYNVERYLDQAISSAQANNRVSIEILVINDGSTDNTLELARAHARRDSRIRIIDKPNAGYGATMNRGIDEARGRYIAILEPDDWVAPHMYDELIEYARSLNLASDPDIIKGPYWRIWMPETEQQRQIHCSYYQRIDPPYQPFRLTDCPKLVQHHPSIWSAIYRRDLLRENNIRFKELPGAGWVDNPFLFETMCQAQSIIYLDKPFYCYREDLPGSSSANRVIELSFERWHDMCDICDRLKVDQGIRRALDVIGFRYVGAGIEVGALEDENLIKQIQSIFERMDATDITSLENVSPTLRQLAFDLTSRQAPHFSTARYYQIMVEEFIYSLKTNGLGFAIKRSGIFLHRRTTQDKNASAQAERSL